MQPPKTHMKPSETHWSALTNIGSLLKSPLGSWPKIPWSPLESLWNLPKCPEAPWNTLKWFESPWNASEISPKKNHRTDASASVTPKPLWKLMKRPETPRNAFDFSPYSLHGTDLAALQPLQTPLKRPGSPWRGLDRPLEPEGSITPAMKPSHEKTYSRPTRLQGRNYSAPKSWN